MRPYARIEIDEAIRTPSSAAAGARTEATGFPAWQVAAVGAVALATGAAVGTLVVWLTAGSGNPLPAYKLEARIPPNTMLGLGRSPGIAISPDGTRLVIAVRDGSAQRLYRRDMAGDYGWSSIDGTEGAEGPFFKPDGNSVGFFARGELSTVSYDGGESPRVVTTAGDPHGGSWGADGMIYFSAAHEIWRVRQLGPTAERMTTLDPRKGELAHRWPQVLPNGDVLFTIWADDPASTTIATVSADPGEPTVSRLLAGGGLARYASSGHLLFARESALWAIEYDPGSVPTGDPVDVLDHVLANRDIGVAYFALSDNGSMVFVEGDELRPGPVLAWVDPRFEVAPQVLPLTTIHDGLTYPSVSPDGRSVLLSVEDDGAAFIGQIDLGRAPEQGYTLQPLGRGEGESSPLFSADGITYVFQSIDASSAGGLFSTVPGSTIGTRPLTEHRLDMHAPSSISNGDLLYYTRQTLDLDSIGAGNEGLPSDVWTVGIGDNPSPPTAFLQGAHEEYAPAVSPNGLWVACVSTRWDEGGEVWVVPSPTNAGGAAAFKVSGPNCGEPVWGSDSLLFHRCGDEMWSTEFSANPNPEAIGEMWFEWPFAMEAAKTRANYDFDSTRGRLLMISDDPLITQTELRVHVDFHDELRRLAGAGR